MRIYKKRTPSHIYRKIYEQHYGPIPKDSDGRTFEVHHKDGDNSNNDPSNLVALTIQEHYDVHYAQGDLSACHMIALRSGKSPEELSTLQKERVENGTHNWVGPESNQKRINEGTHNFVGDRNPSHERAKNGTHNFQGDNNPSHQRLKEGKHHFQNEDWVKGNMEKRNERETHKGKNHPMFDHTIYTFQNVKTGEIVSMIRYEFKNLYHINDGNLSQVINGKRPVVQGWTII